MKNILFAAMIAALALPAYAVTQQEKMKACNADASKQALKGDARKAFMKDCLSAKKEGKEEKKVASQQDKMKTCNAEAKAKNMSGDARKNYMKECLSAK